MTVLTGTMESTTWDEKPLECPEVISAGPKMTTVKTQRKFEGVLNGQGVAFYSMVYHPNETGDPHKVTATFNGLMYFAGEVKGKGKGEIVFKSIGSYGSEGAVCQWESDPNTGTGDLAGLAATGGYKAKGMSSPITLEIQVEA